MAHFQSPLRALLALAVAVLVAYSRASSRLLTVEPGDAVLVTGSSTGIGKHAALSLAREGYLVFACVRRTADGDALLQSAEKYGVDPANVKPLIFDVTNPKHIAKGVDAVTSFVGERGLKGLFNNAGIGYDPNSRIEGNAVEHMKMDQYRRVFDVNFFGLVEVTKAFLPLLRRGEGRIVMTSSVAGFLASPFWSAYASSKHAVEGFSDSLRREVRPHGVEVSVIEPGFVATPIFKGYSIPSGIEPYAEAERRFAKQFWKAAIGSASPRVTSEAVLHAIRAERPNIRYIVGKDAGVMKLLRYLPFSWMDAMCKSMCEQDGGISEVELAALIQDAQADFEL